MNKLKNLLLIVLVFTISSTCKKEKDDDLDHLYIKFSANDIEYNLNEGIEEYEDFIYYRRSSMEYLAFGGGLHNTEYQLSNSSYTSINVFEIIFHSTYFEDIVKGHYRFKESIYGIDTIQSGIEIRWMNIDEWNKIISAYVKTSEYQDCVSSFDENGEKYCTNSMRDYSDFFSTRNINQPESSFEITRTELKLYEKMWYCDDSDQKIYDLLVEGNFKCKTLSHLDSTNVQSISGTFTIHVPSPLKFDCNVSGY